MIQVKNFKSHVRINKYSIIGISSIIVVLALWLVLTVGGIVKPLYFPSPIEVLLALEGIGTRLIDHVIATLARVLAGYVIGSFIGIAVGLLMSYSRFAHSVLHNIIESWRPIPPVALIPFFILWFGFSDLGKIVLVSFGSMMIMVVNTFEAGRNIRPIYLRAAYSLGANKKRVFETVIVPGIMPQLTSGLRVALALSVSLVIVSEFMGAESGLGYLINISKVTFSTQTILLAIIIIGILSASLDWLLRKAMNNLTQWAERSEEAIT